MSTVRIKAQALADAMGGEIAFYALQDSNTSGIEAKRSARATHLGIHYGILPSEEEHGL